MLKFFVVSVALALNGSHFVLSKGTQILKNVYRVTLLNGVGK
jgi:hypothetical protein